MRRLVNVALVAQVPVDLQPFLDEAIDQANRKHGLALTEDEIWQLKVEGCEVSITWEGVDDYGNGCLKRHSYRLEPA